MAKADENAAKILEERRLRQRERQRKWRRAHGQEERFKAAARRDRVRKLEAEVAALKQRVKALEGVEVELGV